MIASKLLPSFIILNLFGKGHSFLLDISCSSASPPLSSALRSFDFSSKSEWDEFYKRSENTDSIGPGVGSSSARTTTETEWHSSISLEEIASVVPPNGNCLIVGCGNSNLPDKILKQRDRPPPRRLVLFDSSQACLDQLKERYHQSTEMSGDHLPCGSTTSQSSFSNTEIDYICGDATRLSKYFGIDKTVNGSDDGKPENKFRDDEESLFDIIIDKGLTDAILCGEGWDGPLQKLFCESSKILSADTGRYLLISYQLPSSTKDFLIHTGDEVGLEWEFDFDLANNATSSSPKGGKQHQRVSVALAKKVAGSPFQANEAEQTPD